MVGRWSITVTAFPRAVSMEAYSRPITPAPTTIICLPMVSMARSWSESTM